MSRIFLITRPQHEYRVSYLYAWSKEILDFAENKGIKFTDFNKEEATRENIEKYLKKKNPGLVIFNGHGTEDGNCIMGHKDEPIIECGINTGLLKDKIIYARACFASKRLGNDIIEKGGRTFIGYSGQFSWVHSEDRECIPSKDKIAEPFKRISNIIPISLLDGNTTKEAHEKAKKLCLKLIQEYSASGNDELDKEIRFWLFVDMQIQELLGDVNATF